jgi:hypothetical protein
MQTYNRNMVGPTKKFILWSISSIMGIKAINALPDVLLEHSK